jgi:hypothetical protein
MIGATLTASTGAYFVNAERIRTIIPARPIAPALSGGAFGAVFFDGLVIPLCSLGASESPIVVCEVDDDLLGIAGFARIDIEEQAAHTPTLDLQELVDEIRRDAWQTSARAKENRNVG